MRLLHTSDWHLCKKLKEHDRTNEFREFLSWLAGVIESERPDALIVSGDIFDTATPSIDAQEMYYTFLGKTAGRTCRHIIITAGNHDSAPFIDAPAEIMTRCSVTVIGRARDEEIIPLTDERGNLEAVICAVPFLHDSDTGNEIIAGIKSHYERTIKRAREIRGGNDIPIIAAGHLFLEAGSTMPDEGERAVYLGTAIRVGTDIFPDDIAYVALGHLHKPQRVGRDNIRYSGSPIAMSFGELGVPKTVSIVDFDGGNFAGVRAVQVPVWQKMARISGDMADIGRKLNELSGNESVWVEVTYTGSENPGNIRERLAGKIPSNVEILSIRDESTRKDSVTKTATKTINDMKPREMLELYFDENGITDTDRERFTPLYREILSEMELDY